MKVVFVRITPLFIFLFGFTALLSGQETRQMTLEDAIRFAQQENSTILEAQIDIADANYLINERRSIGLPQLSADVTFQRYLRLPPLPNSFTDGFGQIFGVLDSLLGGGGGGGEGPFDGESSIFFRNNFTMGVSLDAMLFDASYFTGLKAARAFQDYTRLDLDTKRQQVRNDVIQAALPLFLVRENRQLLEKNIVNLEKLLFETSELYKAGFAEQLDVDRLELSLANLQAELDNLNRQETLGEVNLKFVMSYPQEEQLEITGDLESMLGEVSDKDLVGVIDASQRSEYSLAEKGIELNEINVSYNKIGYLPSLRAFGAYQYAYQGNNSADGFWAPTAYVGVRLQVPIFDGLLRKSLVQRAQLEVERAKLQQAILIRSISLEVKAARVNYQNALKRLDLQKRNMALAERIYNTTQIKYREGVGSSIELTQAEQSLYETQSNYLQSLYDLVVAKTDLDKAFGR